MSAPHNGGDLHETLIKNHTSTRTHTMRLEKKPKIQSCNRARQHLLTGGIYYISRYYI